MAKKKVKSIVRKATKAYANYLKNTSKRAKEGIKLLACSEGMCSMDHNNLVDHFFAKKKKKK